MKIIITEQQLKRLIKEGTNGVIGKYKGRYIDITNEDSDAIPFFYYNNKVYIGYNPELGYKYAEYGYVDSNGENNYPNFHSEIEDFYKFLKLYTGEMPKSRNAYEYIGRMWFNEQVISFWKYPEDMNVLKKILKLLSEEIKKIYNENITFEDYLVDLSDDSADDSDENALVPIKKYVKGKNASKEELDMPHLMPAKDKKSSQQMQGAIADKYKNIGDKLAKIPQAEYNFYKKYGIGDSKKVKIKSNQQLITENTYNEYLNVDYILSRMLATNEMSFYDVYPGYSEPEDEYEETMFFTKENAIRHAQFIIDVFDSLPNPIKIYRTLSVSNINNINLEYPGESWSFSKESALQFGSHINANVLLSAFVKKEDVDWKSTIDLFIMFSGNMDVDDENEINIKDESKIKNVKINMLKQKNA